MRQDRRLIALFVGSILVLGAIVCGPLLYSFTLTLYSAESFIAEPKWVALDNYVAVLEDPLFWQALLNGVTIAVAAIVLQIPLGLGIALVLNRYFFGQTVVRAIAVMPYLLPVVVTAMIAQWILEPNYGVLKNILATLGFGMFDWAADPFAAKATIILLSVWMWTPFVITCVLAGLQNIPVQLYEAARVDGAGAWKQFWHITLPGLRSVLIVVLLFRTIYMFNKFDIIWLTTQGGPLNETETLPTLAYRKAFLEFDVGAGATVATISFVLLASVILVYLRFFPLDDAKQVR